MKTSHLVAPLFLGLAFSSIACVGEGGGSGGAPEPGPLPEPTDWHALITGPLDQESMTVAVGADGRVVLAGYAEGITDFGLGATTAIGVHDLFVAAYAPDGHPLFARRFGGQDVVTLDMAVDADGFIYVTGLYGDGPLTLGDTVLELQGLYDGFVAKLDPAGEPLWAHRWGGPDEISQGGAVVVADDGDVLVAGNQTYDLVFSRFSPDGEVLFETHAGSGMPNTGLDSAIRDAVLTPDGDLVVTGDSISPLDLGGAHSEGKFPVILAARISGADGHPLWARAFGSEEGFYANAGNAVVLAPDGDPVLVGSFAGTLDFDDAALEGNGAFLVKLSAETGEHVWSRTLAASRTSLSVDVDGELCVSGSTWDPQQIAGAEVPAGSFLLGVSPADGADLWARPVPELGVFVSESENGSFGSGDFAIGPDGQSVFVTSFFDASQTSFGPIESRGWGDVLVVQITADSR